jgi:hypothetical protein
LLLVVINSSAIISLIQVEEVGENRCESVQTPESPKKAILYLEFWFYMVGASFRINMMRKEFIHIWQNEKKLQPKPWRRRQRI